jgi:hypothetical protein
MKSIDCGMREQGRINCYNVGRRPTKNKWRTEIRNWSAVARGFCGISL